jgi:hypothetical protein
MRSVRCLDRPVIISVVAPTIEEKEADTSGIRAMTCDLDRLPAAAAAPGVGPALLAAELLGRMRAELPMIGELGSGSRSWRPPG